MRTYEKYKDSGITWIGEIPEQWEVKKLKYISQIISGATPSSTEEEYWDGDIFWVTTDDLGKLKTDKITNSRRKITKAGFNSCGTKMAPIGSIVISSRAPIGHMGKLEIVACTNQGCKTVIFGEEFNSDFFYFFLQTAKADIQTFGKGTTFQELPTQALRDYLMVFPNLVDQTSIANYLNTKANEIDQSIADKEALLNLYEEEKKVLINEAVTKGLNPKVKLKPSGIDWLGDIPEHWEVKKLKYVTEIVLGKMLTPDDKGAYSLKPYLRAQNIRWLEVDIAEVKEMWFSDNELVSYKISEGDILVSEGGEVGRACIWKNELEECYIQNSVFKIAVKEGESYFYLYQFYILGAKDIFNSIVNKVSIGHLTKEKLKEIPFSVPSLIEQIDIVQYIETESAKINEKITLVKQEIELLKEFRQALIFEAVTGKICVQ